MALSGTKTREEIFTYLSTLAVAVLSTIDEGMKPYAAIIYFLPDQELNFYFLTKSDTKKSKNLAKHAFAALTIIDPNSPRSVQATGTVNEIEESEMYIKIMAKIGEENAKGNSFYWPPPLSKLDSSGDLVLYKFTPSWLRFADFTDKTSDIFYTVIPQK